MNLLNVGQISAKSHLIKPTQQTLKSGKKIFLLDCNILQYLIMF